MQYKINNDELMHYGVLGMKWGVRNAETRRKYDTQQRGRTAEDIKGRLIIANDKTIAFRKGRAHRKALRAANKAAREYVKDKKSRSTIRDELSVKGNAYTEAYKMYTNNSLKARATRAGQKKAEKILAKKKQQRLQAEETRKERILGEHNRLQSVYKDASNYIKVDKTGNIRFTPEFKKVVGVGPEEFDDLEYMYVIADEYHRQK